MVPTIITIQRYYVTVSDKRDHSSIPSNHPCKTGKMEQNQHSSLVFYAFMFICKAENGGRPSDVVNIIIPTTVF